MAIGDSTRINTNIAAYNALNALKSVNRELEISQLRLATGKRINEVAEDPAGYTISKRLESRARGISVAIDNVGTAKNVLSIAEGGLTNISDILITIKEKVTQAASDTLGSAERNAIKTEIDQFISEIDNIVSETTFNNQTLIDGTFSGISVQTGEGTTNTLNISIAQNSNSSGLSITSGNVSSLVFTASGASTAMNNINQAIETVSASLQDVGALNSRLTFKENTLNIALTNTEATRSRILDADIASEQLTSTRYLILQQTSTAQLAQANITPQNVLALFT